MGTINIEFLIGNHRGESIEYDSDQIITFGRDKNCTIALKDSKNSSISRQHANLFNYILTDTSTNGTIVNGKKIRHTKIKIKHGDKIQFSPDDAIQINFIDRKAKLNKSDISKVPSFTKIIPSSKSGFINDLMSQPFMLPGIITVIAGVLFFAIISGALETKDIFYLYLYQLLLGVYFGSMIIFFIKGISGLSVPFWIPFSSALIIVLLMLIQAPFALLSLVFRPPLIDSFMNSNNVLTNFIGHFVGAGLMEELFKSIPVWIACFSRERLRRLNIDGINKYRITPTLTVLIGASAAIGFIIIETLLQYVPRFQNEMGYEWGFMLLIPRFITGIAGHVAWSGIFAYFIGLKFYYKNSNLSYPLFGWVFASILHGLWNASSGLGTTFSIAVAIVTFIAFMGYLFKARSSFDIK